MRYQPRTHRADGNQALLIKALREIGANVIAIGHPVDLLVGYRGKTYLFEVKDRRASLRDRKLREGQQKFFDEWRGGPLVKVETLAEAFRVLGVNIEP